MEQLWVDFPLTFSLRLQAPANGRMDEFRASWQQAIGHLKLSVKVLQDGKLVPHSKKGDLAATLTEAEGRPLTIACSTAISVDPRYYGMDLQVELSAQLSAGPGSAGSLEQRLRLLVDAAYHGSAVSPERAWTTSARFSHPLRIEARVDELGATSSVVSVFVHSTSSGVLSLIRAQLLVAQSKVSEEVLDEGSQTEAASSCTSSLTSSFALPVGCSSSAPHSLRCAELVTHRQPVPLLPRNSKVWAYRVEHPLGGAFVCPFALQWGTPEGVQQVLEVAVPFSIGSATSSAVHAAAASTSSGVQPLALTVRTPSVVLVDQDTPFAVEVHNCTSQEVRDCSLAVHPSGSAGGLLQQTALVPLGDLLAGQRRTVHLTTRARAPGAVNLAAQLIVTGSLPAHAADNNSTTHIMPAAFPSALPPAPAPRSSSVSAGHRPVGIAHAAKRRPLPHAHATPKEVQRRAVSFQALLPIEVLAISSS